MKSYVSVHPITLEELMEKTGWVEGPDSDSIVDGYGNQAFVVELGEGLLQLDVDEESDVLEILELVPFHRENAEDAEAD